MSDQEKMREQCLSEFKEGLAHYYEMVISETEENCYRDGWQACAAHYERQLAAAQNHIEALQRIIDEENKDHIEQQAALQADNVRLREVARRLVDAMQESAIRQGECENAQTNYSSAVDYEARYADALVKEIQAIRDFRLSLEIPLDTSALDSLLAEERKVPDDLVNKLKTVRTGLANRSESATLSNDSCGQGYMNAMWHLLNEVIETLASSPQPVANKFRFVGRCVHGKAMWAVDPPESQDLYVLSPQPEKTEGKKT